MRAHGGWVALEGPGQDVGAGALHLVFLGSCQYQRKDSPGEMLTLSPDPLHHGDRNNKRGNIQAEKTGTDKRKAKEMC